MPFYDSFASRLRNHWLLNFPPIMSLSLLRRAADIETSKR
jgi:hypothetical protein